MYSPTGYTEPASLMAADRIFFQKCTDMAVELVALRQKVAILKRRRLSINVRITAVRKLAVEAADNGLLAPKLATDIT